MRRLVGVVLLVSVVGVAGSASAADGIVGFWNYSGGVVQVRGSGTSFTGTVVKATRFSSCTHPVGEVMWHITKSAGGYTGTHSWFKAGDCKPGSAGLGRSTWSLSESGGSLVLRFCTTSPSKSADTRCVNLTRAKPVAKPWPRLPDALVTLASVANGCGGGTASTDPRWGDTSKYLNSNNPFGTRYKVNFRAACNLHDAGYSGAKVRDSLNGGAIIDYFTWSQHQIDVKFLRDMRKLCDEQIPAAASVARADCKARGGKTSLGAQTRYNFVHNHGARYYRARPRLTGSWSVGGVTVAITQNVRSVRGAWTKGDLKGEFRGTVISRDQDSVIRGFARTTVNGVTKQTPIKIDVDPDKPKIIVAHGAALNGTMTGS